MENTKNYMENENLRLKIELSKQKEKEMKMEKELILLCKQNKYLNNEIEKELNKSKIDDKANEEAIERLFSFEK